ncbi:putative serine/threonine-protein kinase nek2 [Cucumis melo var. makuwa]|uniref:Serine/threonine-protein kinase nek2 n=1 Tax=Cucumis melo var. makuwa TaxID=1194695 RepID=A0A5A7TFX3_CUCMM|nr:putative serine/threonine-protein kinase nek2 [Cucumis melo var. makuwa]
MASETRSTTLSINSKMETCKGCGYYVQKYIHEIVHNSSTSITNLFNTKNAYRQEEIDEIRTEWAAFVFTIGLPWMVFTIGLPWMFYMEVYAGILGIIVCIAGELVVTRIRSLGDKKVVRYNEDGAPIGEDGAMLKSFIGSATHYHVPITYTSWKSVPVELKDKIFTTVEAAFVIDPRSRKNVLQTAGISLFISSV